MKKNTIARFIFGLFLALLLAVGAFGVTSVTQAPQAHAATTLTCVYSLTPVDHAPGNWWTEHQKNLYAYSTSQDLTAIWNANRMVISWSDQNYNILGSATLNNGPIGAQGTNQWGISTRWTWFNQNFVHYHWLALWQC